MGFQFMMDRNDQCRNPKEPEVQVPEEEEEETQSSLTNLPQTDEPMDSSENISWENILSGVFLFSLLTLHPSIHG